MFIIHAFTDNNIKKSEVFGGDIWNDYSYEDYEGGKFPKNMTLKGKNIIDSIEFCYESKCNKCGGNGGIGSTYIFKDNEFLNYMYVCKKTYEGKMVVSFIEFQTNLGEVISNGKITGGNCTTLIPDDEYAIAGFYGREGYYLFSVGCIYQIFYYDCPKLEEGKFCNYNHTKILNETEIPEGFFINDTSQKTIDKCYSKCKKCINYGNDENHNCSECISNYYLKNDNSTNCYTGDVEGYFLFDNKYQKCYSTCKNCIGFGNEENHNCSECIPNYYPHKLQNNNESIQCYSSSQIALITTNPIIIETTTIVFNDIHNCLECVLNYAYLICY